MGQKEARKEGFLIKTKLPSDRSPQFLVVIDGIFVLGFLYMARRVANVCQAPRAVGNITCTQCRRRLPEWRGLHAEVLPRGGRGRHGDASPSFRGRGIHQRIEIHGSLQGGSARHDWSFGRRWSKVPKPHNNLKRAANSSRQLMAFEAVLYPLERHNGSGHIKALLLRS